VTAAAQSVEGDMRDSISAELQLNQVQVVRSARLFGPGMRAQIESGSASKKYRQRSRTCVPNSFAVRRVSSPRHPASVFSVTTMGTFGLSIVEAFACGTPAIVRDAGGCREPIDATGGGLVYRTSEELRAALSRLANEPALRERLALCAREGFLRLYTPQRHIKIISLTSPRSELPRDFSDGIMRAILSFHSIDDTGSIHSPIASRLDFTPATRRSQDAYGLATHPGVEHGAMTID
jgi:hypothetical protein